MLLSRVTRGSVNRLSHVRSLSNAVSGSGDYSALSTEVKDGVLVVRLDVPGSPVNTLGEALSQDFERVIDRIESDPALTGAVIISSKPSSWIAGADIGLFGKCETREDMVKISQGAQEMFHRIARLHRPVVAAIHGNCLGGGLETALACHYRVATASPKTVMGVPEVMLGLLPGAGGTQRLPKKVGLQKTLELALTGKMVNAKKAVRMGLVDVVVDEHALEDSAIRACKDIAAGKAKSKGAKKGSIVNRFLEETKYGREIVFSQAKKMVMKQSKGHYPAPLAILDCVRAGIDLGEEAGYRTEREKFGDLGMTPVSKSLISLFHGQTKCKKNAFGKPPMKIENISMIGAGLMGSGIAAVSIAKGYKVALKDMSIDGVARGVANIASIFDKKVKRRSMTQFERDRTISALVPLTDADKHWKNHVSKADVVIEAVFESLDVKRALVKDLEEIIRDDAVIATNTSALPIADIAAEARIPERIVGMHYFSPVEKMPLLEVVTHAGTSKETTSAAVEVGIKQGKTVIVVGDGPGFYTTRILAPFMGEAASLIVEGVDVKKLDAALRKFGFPVGPVTLLDEVGIDVASHIARDLSKAFGERMSGADPELMDKLVAAGFLGRKSGKGFYLYDAPKKNKDAFSRITASALAALSKTGLVKNPNAGGKPINQAAVDLVSSASSSSSSNQSERDLQERPFLRMVNEAVMCLEDGILKSPVDGDIGAVFGLGFPPFYGGPFRYIDAIGADKVVAALERYEKVFGERFTPAKLLVEHAKNGTKFHKD